jgi:uncharacterized protein
MSDRLPQSIDPLQLADSRGALQGKLPLNLFDRLADSLYQNEGCVDVSLVFSREGKLAKIDGQIKSTLALECQNCLGPVEWVVNCKVRLGVVASIDEADRLPEDREPLLVQSEGKVLLKDLVEDELLLALPTFPKHSHDCLSQANHAGSQAMLADLQAVSNENPFSILAKLKNTGD